MDTLGGKKNPSFHCIDFQQHPLLVSISNSLERMVSAMEQQFTKSSLSSYNDVFSSPLSIRLLSLYSGTPVYEQDIELAGYGVTFYVVLYYATVLLKSQT